MICSGRLSASLQQNLHDRNSCGKIAGQLDAMPCPQIHLLTLRSAWPDGPTTQYKMSVTLEIAMLSGQCGRLACLQTHDTEFLSLALYSHMACSS